MFDRLKSLSDDMGIPYSTLGTVALSEYVIRKEREGYAASASVGVLREVLEQQIDSLPEQLAKYEKLLDQK